MFIIPSVSMCIRIGLFTCVALTFIVFPSRAQTIDASTPCAEVRAIFDAPNPDLPKVKAVFQTVNQSLEAFDRLYDSYGKGKILPRMSPDGRKHTAATVTARCDDHPTDTIQVSTMEVYLGLRAMYDAIGIPGQ